MGQLDTFAGAHVIDGVNADDIAAPQRLDADLGMLARFTHIETVRVDIGIGETAGLEKRFGKEKSGAAGGVLLLIVMDLRHLDVIGFTKQGGELGEDVHDDIDADAHVGGAEDEGVLAEFIQFGELFVRKASGADDDGASRSGSGAGVGDGGFRRGEVDDDGAIDLKQLKEEMNQDVVLVSIMWVNNILGSVQPIKEVIDIVKKYKKAHLHVDCVQGICKVIPNFNFNDIDMFTFSTHKIYGPKGIGGLFVREGIELNKRLYGSSSQFSIKPGTFDLSLVASTAKCFIKFYNKTCDHKEDVKKKYLYLREKLEKNNKIVFNTNGDNISYYILNISLIGIRGETIVHTLERDEIYVSTGSSCSSKLAKPEKTIYAISESNERSTSTVRISLSFLTTYEEIDALVDAINKITNGVK